MYKQALRNNQANIEMYLILLCNQYYPSNMIRSMTTENKISCYNKSELSVINIKNLCYYCSLVIRLKYVFCSCN